MEELQVILNPMAGRGYASKVLADIGRNLAALGVEHTFHLTEGPGHAIDLARDLVEAGHHRLASVGGDGTAHEVINGLMMAHNGDRPIELACIPAGSGNDFALMNGLSTDIAEACRTIAAGHTRLVDLGQITLDGGLTRYFDNTVGIGFDGLVAQETRKNKWLRGLALYIPAVLKTIFVTLQTPDSEIIVDGDTSQLAPMMVTTCNGPREGGGFMLAPGALFDDGKLDLVITDRMSRLQMLAMVPRFLKGTHLSHRAVSTRTFADFVMTSADPLYTHVDGEILAEHSHRIHVRVVPSSLHLIAPLTGPYQAAQPTN
jgi:YegS/Rv2252/BmrU family lipid kinase